MPDPRRELDKIGGRILCVIGVHDDDGNTVVTAAQQVIGMRCRRCNHVEWFYKKRRALGGPDAK